MKKLISLGLMLLFLQFFSGHLAAEVVWKASTTAGKMRVLPLGDFPNDPLIKAWERVRFIDSGDGTILDKRTGLIGLKNANCFGSKNWRKAMSAAANLASGSCGLTDSSSAGEWRLPTKKELSTVIEWEKSGAFSDVQSSYFWSSTSNARNTGLAWFVYLGNGYVYSYYKTSSYYVWPVRGGH